MVNAEIVNGRRFSFLPAAKLAIFARFHPQMRESKSSLNIFSA
jgi:hypothetical protein